MTSTDLIVQGAHTVIVVAFLLVGLRVLGKRELAQLNLYDLAMLIAVSNAVQNAMTAGKGALPSAIVTATAVLVPAAAITRAVARHRGAERRIVGSPTLLVHDGTVIASHLRRQRVTRAELDEAIRQRGLDGPAGAAMAVLEVDGSISVVARDDGAPEPEGRGRGGPGGKRRDPRRRRRRRR